MPAVRCAGPVPGGPVPAGPRTALAVPQRCCRPAAGPAVPVRSQGLPRPMAAPPTAPPAGPRGRPTVPCSLQPPPTATPPGGPGSDSGPRRPRTRWSCPRCPARPDNHPQSPAGHTRASAAPPPGPRSPPRPPPASARPHRRAPRGHRDSAAALAPALAACPPAALAARPPLPGLHSIPRPLRSRRADPDQVPAHPGPEPAGLAPGVRRGRIIICSRRAVIPEPRRHRRRLHDRRPHLRGHVLGHHAAISEAQRLRPRRGNVIERRIGRRRTAKLIHRDQPGPRRCRPAPMPGPPAPPARPARPAARPLPGSPAPRPAASPAGIRTRTGPLPARPSTNRRTAIRLTPEESTTTVSPIPPPGSTGNPSAGVTPRNSTTPRSSPASRTCSPPRKPSCNPATSTGTPPDTPGRIAAPAARRRPRRLRRQRRRLPRHVLHFRHRPAGAAEGHQPGAGAGPDGSGVRLRPA